ncbi:hypothetical protein BU26DRAFT_555975 [Trematosphaeria pertusa]|uniref:F-box domain-containing protein n=1 Tax=Trematosphaeria pertusa TaxID=390896 RepID=A0A6A6HVN8_9PLEO|nr:uncharacterized protein BU26DRAFT_555975 [Trematosphaeria pertusa]KAF2241818.1 hypothetical protein BU26DRAFT_555975 [Trematosphaeria pertusa]
MDWLPQELVDKVASYLSKDDLESVLTLSSKLRYAAERHSGAFTSFNITEDNAEKFVVLFSGHRLPYLREVRFLPWFPTQHHRHDPPLACRESQEELLEKDKSFTRQIQFLFTTLRTVEDQASDRHTPGRYRLTIYSPIRLVEDEIQRYCLHHDYVSWRVHLRNPSELPQIVSVQSVEIRNNNEHDFPPKHAAGFHIVESKLDLRVMVDLATRFPNLEFWGCQVGASEWYETYAEEEPVRHYEHDWEGPRRDARVDFARAVEACIDQIPISLRRASLDFLSSIENVISIHHGKQQPNMVYPAPSDLFSSSLRILTRNLRKLQLRAVIDENLFCPGDERLSPWPVLEIFEVMFHPVRPNGKWYFQGPGGEGADATGFNITDECYPPLETSDLDTEMDAMLKEEGDPCTNLGNRQFRVTPQDVNVRQLLESFAKCATNMPSLQQALI